MSNRRHQQKKCCEEGRKFADRKKSHLCLRERKHHHNGNTAHRDQLRERRSSGRNALRTEKKILQMLIDGTETLRFKRIAIINFDDALALIGLLDRTDQFAERTLRLTREALDALVDPTKNKRKQRRHNESDKRQHPVVVNQDGNETDDLNRIANHRRHDFGSLHERRRSFIDEFRLDFRTAVLHEEFVAPAHHPAEHQRAYLQENTLRDTNKKERAQVLRAAVQNRNADKRERRQVKHDRVLLIEAHIGEFPQNERDQGRGGTTRNHGKAGTDQIPLVGRQITEKSKQLFVAENRKVLEHQLS